MALPLTGITTTIVSQAIGLASNSVNTLCNNYKINKWSKYKPVRYNSVAPNRGVGADWWRANDGNCGLSIPSYQNMSDMFTALRGGANDWNYLPPTGVAGQPLRLADFRGYDAEATPPYSITALKDTYYIGIDNLDAVLSAKTSNPGGILLSDLGYSFNLADMYLGLSFVRNGFTNYAYLTATQKANASGGSLVSTPTTGMAAGTYEVALFFAEFQKELTAPYITNNFFPTFGGYKTVRLKMFTLNISLTGSVDTSFVNYNINIYNSETIGFTLMNCYVIFRYGTRTPSDPEQSGEGQVPLGNINCPVGSTQVLSGQILNVAYDFVDRGGRLYFKTNSGSQFNRDIKL